MADIWGQAGRVTYIWGWAGQLEDICRQAAIGSMASLFAVAAGAG